MAENKIPTILLAVGAVMFVLSGFVLDISEVSSDLCAEDCGTVMGDAVDKDGDDYLIPYYLTIVALVLAVVAIVAAEVPAAAALADYKNYLGIGAGALSAIAAIMLFMNQRDINDFIEENFAVADAVSTAIGGWLLVVGALASLAGGIYGMMGGGGE